MRTGTSSQFGDCKRNGGDDHMTLAEFAKGTTTFAVVIVAGLLSEAYLDRYLAASAADRKAASTDRADASAASSAACVRKDGSWKNWPWSNVPILSPKCREAR
jgi:hypothetical protein